MWILNFEKLLKYNNRFFILRDKVLKKEFINKYYNNLLMRYFDIAKTYKLFIRKYY